MKIHHDAIEVTTNAVFDKSEDMTVDTENIGHVLYLLTEIYTDRESSVVRETVANAIDSHRAAGQTRPVEVTFPTYLNTSFIVQDWGVGMSRAELDTIYRKYGKSTKEGVDNQLGAFGIGAKAPLALSSSFTVAAVKDGKRNIVVISKSEDDRTKMNFLPEQPTNEPNGVTVTVPVAKPREFERVARSPIFLGYKPGDLLVNGKAPSSIHNSDDYKVLDGHGWYEHGGTLTDRGYNPELRVMLDTVPYAIPAEQAEALLADFRDVAPLRTIMQRLVLALPNGSVKVTPNRENFVYSEFTKSAIKRVLAQAVPMMLAHAAKLIADAPDRKTAVLAADSLHAQGLLAPGPLTWRGETFGNLGAGHRGVYAHTYAATEMEREVKAADRLYYAKAHNRGPGLRVSRDYANNIRGHFTNTRRFALVTEAVRNDKGDFTSDSRLGGWFSASAINLGGHYENVGIYTTTRKATELPPFLTAMAETIVTAADVIAIAKANATPRTRRIAQPAVFAITHTRAARSGNKSDMLTTTDPANLRPELKYVIAQASGPNGDGPRTYENALYAYFRAANSGHVINGTESLLKAMTEKGYTFVILPASADRQRYIDALPNVHSIDAALATVFTFEANAIEQEYFASAANNIRAYRYGHNMNTSALYNTERGNLIAQVKDVDTRAYLALYAVRRLEASRLNDMAHLWHNQRTNAAVLKNAGPLTTTAIEYIEAAASVTPRVYPLLANGIPAGAEADAVDYINLIDAKRAAN